MTSNNVIDKTIEFIEANLDQELSLDGIARNAGYSKFHLDRLFAEQVGCTIYKYIKMRRLTNAASQLIEDDTPIVEVAHQANYSSQQAFTLAFRQLYHCTPDSYRKIGVFEPKQSRFTMQCTLLSSYRVPNNYGRMAA